MVTDTSHGPALAHMLHGFSPPNRMMWSGDRNLSDGKDFWWNNVFMEVASILDLKKNLFDKNKSNTLYLNCLDLLKHLLVTYTGVVFIFNYLSSDCVRAPGMKSQKGSCSACSCHTLCSGQHSSHFKLRCFLPDTQTGPFQLQGLYDSFCIHLGAVFKEQWSYLFIC